MKKLALLLTCWFSSLLSIIIFTIIFSFSRVSHSQVLGATINVSDNETETFSSLASNMPEIERTVQFEESLEILIQNYLSKFKAPLELQNEAGFIVAKSEEKGIDPRLIVAIARKESSFCKNIARLPDGSSSNNCGGLGIFGTTITSFSSIHDWVEAEINFISNAYISKGITNTCEIEKTHTPPAKGVWCSAINTYISEMQ